MSYEINRGVKAVPKRVHQVNVQHDANVTLKSIFAGGCPFTAAQVFGCGNPKTTGSTGGERKVISKRIISTFIQAGTAHLANNIGRSEHPTR